nr:porin [Sandaracinobacteroides sayramensis]
MTCLSLSVAAFGQATKSTQTPMGTATGEAVATPASAGYAVPDPVPDLKPDEPGFFEVKPGLVVLLDHTGFSQDEASLQQMGEQRNKWELRAGRLMLNGSIGGGYRVGFQLSGEYKGFDGDPDTTWQLTDMSLSFPIGSRTKLQVGKTKETFAYEMVGDAANLPGAERVLSPFFISRNTGLKLTHVWGPAKRGTFSAGVYNDDWDIGAKERRGVDASGRITALLWAPEDAGRYLHLGLSARHVAAKGEMRYRGRPGSNVSDYFVDTGKFTADGALHLGVEGLLSLNGFGLLGEYVVADVDAPASGNPRFTGWYLAGNWILTGDHRPYDRNVGYARRVVPKGRWGAPELVVRYSDVDLRDGPIDGGRFRRTDLGVNWWATHRWKLGLAWGHVWLDRMGVRGQTDTILSRVQWVY